MPVTSGVSVGPKRCSSPHWESERRAWQRAARPPWARGNAGSRCSRARSGRGHSSAPPTPGGVVPHPAAPSMNQTLRSGPRVSEPPAPCGSTHSRITWACNGMQENAPMAKAMRTRVSRRRFITSPFFRFRRSRTVSCSGADLVATGALGLVEHLVGGLVEIRRAHALTQRAAPMEIVR